MAKSNDWILYAALGAAGIYAVYKFTNSSTEGISKATSGLGSGISEISGGIASPFGFVDKIFDKLSEKLDNQSPVVVYRDKGVSTTKYISDNGSLYGMSGQEIVSNIEKSAREKMNATQKPVNVTPVYDPVSGTGVSSSGFGYSSMKDLGSKGTGTVYTNPKTGSTVKRGEGSLFANVGFN